MSHPYIYKWFIGSSVTRFHTSLRVLSDCLVGQQLIQQKKTILLTINGINPLLQFYYTMKSDFPVVYNLM